MKHKNNCLHIILFFLLLHFAPFLQAQISTSNTQQVLSKTELEHCKNKKPYAAYAEISNEKDNALSRLQTWLNWFFSRLFGNKVSYSFSKILPYLIIVLVLVLIALKFTGLSLSQLMKPSLVKVGDTGFYSENESIQKANFNALINEALEQNNYRMAIRYSYLLLLQQLHIKGFIEWEKQKSNFDYLLAIKKQNFYSDFCDITNVYESAWYGETPWTIQEYKQHFDAINTKVNNINNKLS